MAFESTLERDFLIRLETDRRVLQVISQPLTIEYTGADGRPCPYTPDYLVDYRPGPPLWAPFRAPILVEVKPRAKLLRHFREWRPRYCAAIRYCRDLAYVFHLMDERRIRDQRWENAMFLRRYRKMRFEPAETAWILSNLRAMGTATFDYLLARHFFGERDRAVGIAHLWHMVATNQLACDLAQPLSNFTELWVLDSGW